MSINYILLLAIVFICSFTVSASILFSLFPRYTKVIINHPDGTKTEHIVQKGLNRKIDNLIRQERKRQGIV
jgi:hypothetical protein